MHIAWTIFAGLCCVALLTLFPTTRQRLLGLLLLIPLLAVAVAVDTAGKRVRTESTTAQDDPTAAHQAGSEAAATKPLATPGNEPRISITLAGPKAISDLTWPDPGTEYTAQTLWNRIDGGAEAYSRAGMRRALFATARRDTTDIEVQVFDFRNAETAQTYFRSISRADDAQDFAAGDAAVLWSGGGEVQRGRYYARVVLSTAEPSASLNNAVNELLQTIAAPADDGHTAGSDNVPTIEAKAPTPTDSSNATGPATVAQQDATASAKKRLAETLDVGAHIVELYGLTAHEVVKDGGGEIDIITARDPYAAAAFAGSLLTETTSGFDGRQDEHHILTRGTLVIRARDLSRAQRLAASRTTAPLPGLSALEKRAQSLEIQLNGWNGKRQLGGVLTGTLEDDSDVFIATPSDMQAAWKELTSSYSTADVDQTTRVTAEDDYQGKVLFVRNARVIIGVVAYEDLKAATTVADVLLAEL